MTQQKKICFPNRDAVTALFQKLIEAESISGILLPKKNGAGHVVPTLITDPEFLQDTDPFAPLLPVSGGRIAKNLTFTGPHKKVVLVCKPCEVKAIVELTKFEQVKRKHLLLISVDCYGTYEVKDYHALDSEGTAAAGGNQDYVKRGRDGTMLPGEEYGFRKACTICETPTSPPIIVDAHIGFIGIPGEEFSITVNAGELLHEELHEALSALGPEEFSEETAAERTARLDELKEKRSAAKTQTIEAFRSEYNSLEKLQELYSACIRCHNCMVTCPICYCKECIFRSPTFDHSSDMIAGWAERKGAMRMMENTMMFHLTRMNHMASSCIGCGLCSSACPVDIDVATAFISTGEEIQSMLEYNAGEDYESRPPVTTFREKELDTESGAQ
jgi:formate dehydrogenase (coenzyme F420) beta subunit